MTGYTMFVRWWYERLSFYCDCYAFWQTAESNYWKTNTAVVSQCGNMNGKLSSNIDCTESGYYDYPTKTFIKLSKYTLSCCTDRFFLASLLADSNALAAY